MTTRIAIVLPVVLVSLLIAGSFENGLKTQAMAQNSNSSPSTNNNNGSLTLGTPQLPLSDQPIHGPIQGTQAPYNCRQDRNNLSRVWPKGCKDV
jgi:hypothetical protein